MTKQLYFLYLFCFLCSLTCQSLQTYDLPVVPESLKKQVLSIKPQRPSDKFIPRIAWIAVRNISDEKPKHMLGPTGFIERNNNWKMNFCDNEMKDRFMEENFAGSSILWAYNILNPAIGTSKVEIWRLAVLYLHGGKNCNHFVSARVVLYFWCCFATVSKDVGGRSCGYVALLEEVLV